jgi:hypothetical protein
MGILSIYCIHVFVREQKNYVKKKLATDGKNVIMKKQRGRNYCSTIPLKDMKIYESCSIEWRQMSCDVVLTEQDIKQGDRHILFRGYQKGEDVGDRHTGYSFKGLPKGRGCGGQAYSVQGLPKGAGCGGQAYSVQWLPKGRGCGGTGIFCSGATKRGRMWETGIFISEDPQRVRFGSGSNIFIEIFHL